MTTSATSAWEDVAEILPLGAIIQEFKVEGLNIVQNFPTAELYEKYNEPYFGETIGRVANRISGAKINELNGRSYQLAANNGPNCLHGGVSGWGKKIWQGPKKVDRNGAKSIEFRYVSKDGEEGFPGETASTVWYTQRLEKGPNGEDISVLETEYEVELVGNGVEETVVGMTSHSYFNLTGGPSIENTRVTLSTDLHMPVGDDLIPTGDIVPYPGGFAKTTFTLGPEEPDIDHCFILNISPESVPIDTRSRSLNKLASFYHPDSRIHLEIHSTEPAFQFYTGKYIEVPAIGDIPARGKRSGFCVEPSRYVNAVNTKAWKKMVLLRKGEKYGCRNIYRAWKSRAV